MSLFKPIGDTEYAVERTVPLSAVENAVNKRVLRKKIHEQMAREAVDVVLEKMEFIEETDQFGDQLIFRGVVHIASRQQMVAAPELQAPAIEKPPKVSSLFTDVLDEPMTAAMVKQMQEESVKTMTERVQSFSNPFSPDTYAGAVEFFKQEQFEDARKKREAEEAYRNAWERELKIRHQSSPFVQLGIPERKEPDPRKEGWAGTKYRLTDRGEQIMSKQFWETGNRFEGEQSEIDKYDKVHVLIDGDIIAYRCAATCDGRYYEVGGKRFAYKKDAVSYADKKSIPNSEITSGYEPEPIEAALHNCAVSVDQIKHYFIYELKLNPVVKLFLSGDTNFRYDIYPEYKAHRKKDRKPHWLKDCKEYLQQQFNGFRFEGFEADDLIGMTVTALLSQSKDDIYIASNDKDFTQLLGDKRVHQYDFTTSKVWQVEPMEAVTYFYKQLLIGDKSDNIPGIPKVGPQTAIKMLAACEEERDFYNAVVMAYKKKLDMSTEEAVDAVELRGKLLHLLRKENEMWTPPAPRTENSNEQAPDEGRADRS